MLTDPLQPLQPLDELHLLALRAINALPPVPQPLPKRVRLYCWEATRRTTGVDPRR